MIASQAMLSSAPGNGRTSKGRKTHPNPHPSRGGLRSARLMRSSCEAPPIPGNADSLPTALAFEALAKQPAPRQRPSRPTKDQGQPRSDQTKDAALPPQAPACAKATAGKPRTPDAAGAGKDGRHSRPNCHFSRHTFSNTFFFHFSNFRVWLKKITPLSTQNTSPPPPGTPDSVGASTKHLSP
jgi:hypothetical protein